MSGVFYLHENREIIYKHGYTWADLDHEFVRSVWPVGDPATKMDLWTIAVEAGAMGVPFEGYDFSDDDALIYAGRVGCGLFQEGSRWVATRRDYCTPVGIGDSGLSALAGLCRALEFNGRWVFSDSFLELVRPKEPTL